MTTPDVPIPPGARAEIGWRDYHIRSGVDGRWFEARAYYAPSLDMAFAMARRDGTFCTQWECLGAGAVFGAAPTKAAR